MKFSAFGQAKGPEVPLRVFGDEHYARYEDLNGYTTVYDDDRGLFCYARLAAGALRSTGVPISERPPAGLARHLQEAQQTVVARASARKLRRTAMAGGRREAEVVRTFGPNQGLLEGRVLSIGRVKGLTILVNFQDVTSTVTRADIDEMLNGTNYTRNGNICSAREYFAKVSSGKLDYTNTVVGPYTLTRNREFYVNNLLVEEALQLAVADGLDLKQFDSRNENIVDALNVLYAGQTQYRGELWPHNWYVDLRHGGVRTELYLLTSLGRTASDLSIGTFCHENGHLLCRFPDMYDYGEREDDSVSSAGIGSYCLMGSGNHNDSGRSPSPVCAYLRDLAGWCDNEVALEQCRRGGSQAGRLQHSVQVQHVEAERVFPGREPLEDGPGPRLACERPCRVPLRYPRLQRVPARHCRQALPVCPAAGRRPPRPRAQRQPGRRRRPVRRDRRRVAVGHVHARIRGSGTGALQAS